jgi:membrane protein DedA with SNARE-associated domain
MTEILIQYIQAAAEHAKVWGPLLILVCMTIESSFIPLPSEVVMIPAGFLAARGALPLGSPIGDMVVSIALGTLGSLAGAYINYFLFRWLGVPFLEKYGKYFFLPPDKLHRAEEVFREYGAGATFVCRLLPGLRHLISIPAGIAGMPLGSFSLWTSVGAGIWVTVLAVIGYYLGLSTAEMSYADIVHYGRAILSENLVWIVLGCAVVFAVYVLVHKRIMTSKAHVATVARST